ncbi:hypothetical protein QBC37DRAFT_401441 [Rhypophila decipiens]|uniref:Uncharacterized protein n=1 Tax=Rhypophila decipiens TaxID=261697 RepID=A0AAN7B6X2_9PEZI|nr:hypothetical protein QBC37DRAFT_401441 [Rhypophila decipiens]
MEHQGYDTEGLAERPVIVSSDWFKPQGPAHYSSSGTYPKIYDRPLVVSSQTGGLYDYRVHAPCHFGAGSRANRSPEQAAARPRQSALESLGGETNLQSYEEFLLNAPNTKTPDRPMRPNGHTQFGINRTPDRQGNTRGQETSRRNGASEGQRYHDYRRRDNWRLGANQGTQQFQVRQQQAQAHPRQALGGMDANPNAFHPRSFRGRGRPSNRGPSNRGRPTAMATIAEPATPSQRPPQQQGPGFSASNFEVPTAPRVPTSWRAIPNILLPQIQARIAINDCTLREDQVATTAGPTTLRRRRSSST